MTVIMLLKDLKKEKVITIKVDYLVLIDFLEYLYFKGLNYKVLKIIKRG